MQIQTSDENRDYGTGASRDQNKSKGRYDLIPPMALRRVAKHYQAGAAIRGRRNWELGMPLEDMLDSAIRHLYNYIEDKIIGRPHHEDHLAAAVWNVMGVIETEERIFMKMLPPELDGVEGVLKDREEVQF